MRRLGGHCTADEITGALQKGHPGFSRSTVYRALEALAASGAIHAVRLGAGPIHYEVAAEIHQHAICQSCQGIFHIEHSLIAELESHLQERHHFQPVRVDVVVTGVCEACAQGRAPVSRPRASAHIHYD